MLVVTGSPRTGTSAMMQTLKILGITPVSPAFQEEHKGIERHNIKGYYEPNLGDILSLKDTPAQAVKLFGSALPYVKKDIVNKMIIMKRNKQQASNSYKPIMEELGEDYDADFVYDTCYSEIDKIKVGVDNIEINYEDLLENPEQEIDRIVQFLNIDSSAKTEAIKNIQQ